MCLSAPSARGGDFFGVLRTGADRYFRMNRLSKRDTFGLYIKAAVVLTWFVLSYALLVWVATGWWQAVALGVSLGLSASAVGFNIQHDGGHRSFSRRKWINRMAASTLDLLGGSSYLWHFKHNLRHHTYPNIDGLDDDIDVGILARFAPHQTRRRAHRYQHIYVWLLYPLLALKWQFFDDFHCIWTGLIGEYRFPRPGYGEILTFVLGKIVMLSTFLIFPLSRHPVAAVVPIFLVYSFTHGFTLAVTFQLGHCVEGVLFPERAKNASRSDWAYHQVRATSNFTPGNRVLSWFIGGLNFQIEHHLFPRIAHIHYPALAPIVREVCREFGVHYEVKPSLMDALRAHHRWLRRMGM